MPKMIFGIADIHRSHRIEVPRPADNARDQRPNACTNCHLDRSIDWAQIQTDALWGNSNGEYTDNSPSHLLESLHAGDPVQRAVAARMAGNNTALPASQFAWLIPHLIIAMEDNYPSTRNLARKSLLHIHRRLEDSGIDPGLTTDLESFDFIGDKDRRTRLIVSMRQHWRAFDKASLPTPPTSTMLDANWEPRQPQTAELVRQGHRHSKQIAIGE